MDDKTLTTYSVAELGRTIRLLTSYDYHRVGKSKTWTMVENNGYRRYRHLQLVTNEGNV